MFSIRQFRQQDTDDVRRLFVESQRQFSAGLEREIESYIEDTLAGDLSDIPGNYINRPGSNFWIVEAGEQVIGMVGLQRRDAATCEVRRMAVDSRWRRKGIGRSLLETAEDFARSQGFESMVLSTITPLQPAISLYEGAGFGLTGQGQYGAVTVLHYSRDLLSDPSRPGGGQS